MQNQPNILHRKIFEKLGTGLLGLKTSFDCRRLSFVLPNLAEKNPWSASEIKKWLDFHCTTEIWL